jgi:hypothetical protein
MGALVSDDLKASDKTSNSDFWFPSENVAAELKVMSKNYFADATFQEWLSSAYLGWVVRGLAPRTNRTKIIVNLADLNPQCYKEVESFVRRRLESSFKTASKQIQATKRSHKSVEGTGILFLINDGNYGVVPAMIQNIVARSLSKYSGINTVIFFSANMPMRSGETERDVLPWCTWSKSSVRPPVDRDLLERIKENWFSHIGSIVGESIHEIPSTGESLAKLDYLRKVI